MVSNLSGVRDMDVRATKQSIFRSEHAESAEIFVLLSVLCGLCVEDNPLYS